MKEQNDFSDLKRKISVATTGEFKTIELTDEQYVRLITLLKVGIRTVHAAKDDDLNVPLIDIDQYISSYAQEFNAGHLIERSDEFGGLYFYTKLLKLKIEILQEKYLDHYLYDELSTKLAKRDLFRSAMGKQSKKPDVSFEKIKKGYMDELIKNDLDNVTVGGQKASP